MLVIDASIFLFRDQEVHVKLRLKIMKDYDISVEDLLASLEYML